MTVMVCGLAEIRMEMNLLEMGVQLVILPTTCFRTTNATSYWYFTSSPQRVILVFRVFSFFCLFLNRILCPSSMVVSSNPVDLTSARPRMSMTTKFMTSSCTIDIYSSLKQCTYVRVIIQRHKQNFHMSRVHSLFYAILHPIWSTHARE